MNAPLVVLGLIVLCALAAAVTVPALRRSRPDTDAAMTTDDATAAVARYLRAARWLAVPVAVLVAVLAFTGLDDAGWLASVVFGALAVVMVVVLAEWSAPKPAPDAVRTAPLTPRDPHEYPGRRRLAVARGAVLLALAVCGLGIALGADDGRSVQVTCAAGAATASPFPGLAVVGPAMAGLVALLSVTEVALGRIARRPRRASAAADDALRSASAALVTRVVAAAGLLVTAAVCGLAAMQLRGLDGPCPAGWRSSAGAALAVLALAALGALGAVVADAVTARVRHTTTRV